MAKAYSFDYNSAKRIVAGVRKIESIPGPRTGPRYHRTYDDPLEYYPVCKCDGTVTAASGDTMGTGQVRKWEIVEDDDDIILDTSLPDPIDVVNLDTVAYADDDLCRIERCPDSGRWIIYALRCS